VDFPSLNRHVNLVTRTMERPPFDLSPFTARVHERPIARRACSTIAFGAEYICVTASCTS
jgi:hypothetical protein